MVSLVMGHVGLELVMTQSSALSAITTMTRKKETSGEVGNLSWGSLYLHSMGARRGASAEAAYVPLDDRKACFAEGRAFCTACKNEEMVPMKWSGIYPLHAAGQFLTRVISRLSDIC